MSQSPLCKRFKQKDTNRRSIYWDSSEEIHQEISSKRSRMNLKSLIDEKVHYVPVRLTSLQKELYRVLIKLHEDSLLGQIKTTTNGDIKEEAQEQKDHKLNTMLIKNLKLVNNHPFLLVEHYIHKKLLLMESNERLMLQSDKFNKFDKIIQNLVTRDLNLLVVGCSVKELDIIEAFLQERELECSRSITIVPPREEKNRKKLRISLITSQKLLNLHFPNNTFDLIISFDEELNENEKALEVFRKFNKTPLIKLLLINSFKHGVLSGYQTDKDLLFSSFNPLVENFEDINIESLFDKFFETKEWNYKLPSFKSSPGSKIEEIIQSIDTEMKPFEEETWKGNGTKKIKLEGPKDDEEEELSSLNYQGLLTKLTIRRIGIIRSKISLNNEKINRLRIESNEKNNKEDELKLKISALFKESKELKDTTLFNIEKLFEKLTLENEKYKEMINDLTQPESKEDETEEALMKTLETLKTQNAESELGLDEFRQNYQKYTTEAGELALTLKTLQSTNESLEKNLQDNGQKLRSLKNQNIKLTRDEKLSKMKSEINLLSLYQTRLDELVKERVNTLNVGRNGRVHRSTTPYLT